MILKPLREKLLRDGLWAFVGMATGMLANLLITVLLAKLLSPADVGAYFIIFSFVTSAALIAQFGLPQTLIRLIAGATGTDNDGIARSVIRFVLLYATLGAVLVALIVNLWGGESIIRSLFHLPQLPGVIPLVSCWIMVLTWQGIQAAIFRGFHDIKLSAIFGGMLNNVIGICLLLAVSITYKPLEIRSIIMCFLVSSMISVMIASCCITQRVSKLGHDGILKPMELFSAAVPVFVVVLANMVLAQADIWIVGIFNGAHDVAVYGAASRLARMVMSLVVIVNTVVSPIIVKYDAHGQKQELEKLLQKSAVLTFIPALLLLIFFWFFGERILGGLFGLHYRTGANVLTILAVGTCFSAWSGSCGATLMMTGHQKALMVITIFCSLLTIVASACMAKNYGACGVALAVSAVIILQNTLMLLLVKRKTGIWTHARFTLPEVRQLLNGGQS